MNVGGKILRSARSRRSRRMAGTMLRAVAPFLPLRRPPHQPIFVLGSPRSGTTMLFEVLKRSSEVASMDRESHVLWNAFHDGRPRRGQHQATAPSAITPLERRALYWAIQGISSGRRYLDKAPQNSLRVDYLNDLFPDARFVFLKRDGRACVSSLITAWKSRTGPFPGWESPAPLSIRGYNANRWKFVMPPGWEEYAFGGRALEQVCAFQWKACNEAILASRTRIPSDRWLELTYEGFVEAPGATTAWLLDRLGLSPDEEVLAYAGDLNSHVVRAVEPPRPDKWREENPAEVEAVLPMIVPTMKRLGYELTDSR